MANNCLFDMRISGKRENALELIKMMQWKGEYEHNGLGRIFSCETPYKFEEYKDGYGHIDVFGDCAWSVLCAMMAGYREISLESETKRLNLVVEVYSSEPGCCFQEHFVIDRGCVLTSECVDYEEHWVSGYDSLEAYNKDNETNFTEDMINESGDICIGGFGDRYMNWEYFGKEHFV